MKYVAIDRWVLHGFSGMSVALNLAMLVALWHSNTTNTVPYIQGIIVGLFVGVNILSIFMINSSMQQEAARYRWLREHKYLNHWVSIVGSSDKCTNIDEDIDNAMEETE